MAGFLDSQERVIDMVLTDVGKSLLLRGELTFKYWIPFDDEVDYDPPAGDLHQNQTLAQRKQELTESPLVREATMGYRGLNLAAEDTTNLHRPMYSVPPGVGQTSPLPRMAVGPGEVAISVDQVKREVTYVQKSDDGEVIADQVTLTDGFQRLNATEALVTASYSAGSYPPDHQPEGFLVTVYHSSSLGTDDLGQEVGGFEEIPHNRDSAGNIAYRNDLQINNYTP